MHAGRAISPHSQCNSFARAFSTANTARQGGALYAPTRSLSWQLRSWPTAQDTEPRTGLGAEIDGTDAAGTSGSPALVRVAMASRHFGCATHLPLYRR